ncbi:MAG TPA: phage tail sheath C-terminal domain-containing protein [Saprospiraceae bacterium]|nr:phage tail sheath C-terminal domain-containing protein [Saprospiraceae bacterium]
MATTYKTPGVYVEEIPKFPPSIAPVETAIPAFIGYTEKAARGKKDLTLVPTLINSLLEFEDLFGYTQPVRFLVDVDFNTSTGITQVDVTEKPNPDFILYYCIKAFYANGGGPCYIVSVGSFLDGTVDIERILAGLKAVSETDEVTLLISPEAVLLSPSQYGQWAGAALKQCKSLQDRFTILDVSDTYKTNADVTLQFRNFVPSTVDEAKYGAAYYPFIETAFSYALTESDGTNLSFIRLYTESGSALTTTNAEVAAGKIAYDALLIAESAYNNELSKFSKANKAKILADKINTIVTNLVPVENDSDKIKDAIYEAVGKINVDVSVESTTNKADLITAAGNLVITNNGLLSAAGTAKGVAETALTSAEGTMSTASNALFAKGDYSYTQLNIVKDNNNGLYNQILDTIKNSGVVLPPSSLIAGKYAEVDNTRGVWKAPANVSLDGIIQPTILISSQFQSDLNVDTLAGKSVNAIRPFAGKGSLVWGARTLAGNDNEWRYINVRRFFIFIEESTKKATEQFVFEPNDANTWVKVQAMIENFLNTYWRQGALQGVKPEHAFYVAVGLNKTMRAIDILEGRMIIEIGLAVVRPAEFIILRFSHKMPES